MPNVSSLHVPFKAASLKTGKGHIILLCRSEYPYNPDISRAHLSQNYMTAMEKHQPLISLSPEDIAENLHEKLPSLRLWKEMKANQRQGHVERHEGLRLWNQKEQVWNPLHNLLAVWPPVCLLTSLHLLSSLCVKSSLTRLLRRWVKVGETSRLKADALHVPNEWHLLLLVSLCQ